MVFYHILLYALLGFVPTLAWLWYYLRQDLHPEPKKTILKVFLYGVLVSVPILAIEIFLSHFLERYTFLPIFVKYPLLIGVINWFFIVAFTEEVLKYIGLRFAVLRDGVLDEPMDVMMYMVVVALGFAGLENIFYVVSAVNDFGAGGDFSQGFSVSVVRFFSAVLIHTLCSSLLGYYLVLSFLNLKQHWRFTVTGIIMATLLHGFYDFSIISLDDPMNWLIPLLIIVGLSLFVMSAYEKIKHIKSICKI